MPVPTKKLIPPFVTSDPAEYAYRKAAYADSLDLALDSYNRYKLLDHHIKDKINTYRRDIDNLSPTEQGAILAYQNRELAFNLKPTYKRKYKPNEFVSSTTGTRSNLRINPVGSYHLGDSDYHDRIIVHRQDIMDHLVNNGQVPLRARGYFKAAVDKRKVGTNIPKSITGYLNFINNRPLQDNIITNNSDWEASWEDRKKNRRENNLFGIVDSYKFPEQEVVFKPNKLTQPSTPNLQTEAVSVKNNFTKNQKKLLLKQKQRPEKPTSVEDSVFVPSSAVTQKMAEEIITPYGKMGAESYKKQFGQKVYERDFRIKK